jgi:hypothetical protein
MRSTCRSSASSACCFAPTRRRASFDHLGFLVESRERVDALLARCREWRERDPRVRIKEYEDLVAGGVTVHAFYVKFLLPLWFDVQSMEYAAGAEPAQGWSFGPTASGASARRAQ